MHNLVGKIPCEEDPTPAGNPKSTTGPWNYVIFYFFISVGSLLGSVLMKCGFLVYSFVRNTNAFIIQSCFQTSHLSAGHFVLCNTYVYKTIAKSTENVQLQTGNTDLMSMTHMRSAHFQSKQQHPFKKDSLFLEQPPLQKCSAVVRCGMSVA